jgi:hypothetical protein
MEEHVVQARWAGANLARTRKNRAGWTVIPLQLAERVVRNIRAANAGHRDALISALRGG